MKKPMVNPITRTRRTGRKVTKVYMMSFNIVIYLEIVVMEETKPRVYRYLSIYRNVQVKVFFHFTEEGITRGLTRIFN